MARCRRTSDEAAGLVPIVDRHVDAFSCEVQVVVGDHEAEGQMWMRRQQRLHRSGQVRGGKPDRRADGELADDFVVQFGQAIVR